MDGDRDATYAEWLWQSHRFDGGLPDGPGESMADRDRGLFEQFWITLWRPDLGPPGNPAPEDPFALTVYWRGAMALQALREEIGDQAFFRVLREYVARHAGGNVTTADFVAVAEEIAERDLHDLFDAWLYADRTPPRPD